MPMANVNVAWEIARDRAFASIVQKGEAIARPELGHSVHVEVTGLERAASTSIASARAARSARRAARRPRPPRGSPSTGCDSPSAAAITTRRATSRRSGAWRRNSSTSSSTPATTSTRGAATAAGIPRSSGSITRTRSTRSSTTATATRSTSRIRTSARRTRRRRSSSRGTITRSTTTTPAISTRTARRRKSSSSAAPPPTRPSSSRCRFARASCRRGRTCASTAACSSARSSTSACSTRGSTAPIRRAAARAPRAAPPRSIRRGRSSARRRSSGCSSSSASARATWTVIGQQVPTFARDLVKANPKGRYSMDKWDGYVASRTRLYARLKETKAPNPVVLSGDVHVHYGSDLKMDFENPRSETIGVEFTNSAITSGGDGAEVSGELGGHAWRQPAHQVPQRAARLRRLHRHAEGDARGIQGARSRHAAGRPGTHRRHSRRRSWEARGGARLVGLRFTGSRVHGFTSSQVPAVHSVQEVRSSLCRVMNELNGCRLDERSNQRLNREPVNP